MQTSDSSMSSLLHLIAAVIGSCAGATLAAHCDAETADDGSSLLQQARHKVSALAEHAISEDCEGFFDAGAHATTVKADDVENQLSYLRSGSGAPEVLEGIYWMDQSGYYQTRPDRPDQAGWYEVVPGKYKWYETFPHNLPSAAAELLMSFGSFPYDKATRCVRVSRSKDQWFFANTTGTAEAPPLWSRDAQSKATFQFCFDEPMKEISIVVQACNTSDGGFDGSTVEDPGQHARPRPWGIERLNPRGNQTVTRYAAYQIVDGHGRRTEHYKVWLDFMQRPCWFSPDVSDWQCPFKNDTLCRAKGGWHVNLGNGFSVLGRRGPA